MHTGNTIDALTDRAKRIADKNWAMAKEEFLACFENDDLGQCWHETPAGTVPVEGIRCSHKATRAINGVAYCPAHFEVAIIDALEDAGVFKRRNQ